MEDSLPHPKAELYLENKSNRIFYKKMLTTETTLADILQLSGSLSNLNFNWSEIQLNIPDNEWLATIHLYENHDTLTVSYLYPNPEILFNSDTNPFDNIVNNELSDEVIQERIVLQFPYEIWNRGNEIMSAFDSEELLVAFDGVSDEDQNELVVNYYYDGSWWLIFEHRIKETEKIEKMTVEEIRDIAGKLAAITKGVVNSIVSKLSN